MTSPWSPTKADVAELLAGEPSFRIEQLWHGLYDEGKTPSQLTTLPKSLRAKLETSFQPALELQTKQENKDTVKWLWRLHDNEQIETVLMHYKERSTVCISSQAGCAMGCGFCATGQAGYDRNLSVGEIVEQLIVARKAANPRRLSNVVFMGMGEPFANYQNVMAVIDRILTDLKIGARHVTVSTIGLVPQMLMFAEERLQVGLAVSLHAATNDLRSELVPVNKRHPIEDVVAASQLFRERTGRRVSFEWAMIDGTNDSLRDAEQLAKVASKARAHVNLIPLNPTPGWPTKGSPPDRIDTFVNHLRQAGTNVTVRKNRGTDIDAACGQLRAKEQAVPVKISKPRPPDPIGGP